MAAVPQLFTFEAEYRGNYDGDTIDFRVSLGFHIHHDITVRLLGCDTFEMRDKDAAKKALAQQGKKFTCETLANATRIIIQTFKSSETDVYGRYLAKITVYDAKDRPTDLAKLLTEAKLTTGKWTNEKPV